MKLMFGIQTHQEHLGQNFFISRFTGFFFRFRVGGKKIKLKKKKKALKMTS